MMTEIESSLLAVKAGDTQAYRGIIEAFQDMAFGCAYAMLGDFHLAEDATQEAFIEAFHNLDTLKDLQAFPGWLRRIVRFRCHRLLRRPQQQMVSLDESIIPEDHQPGPDRIAGERELQQAVMQAIAGLSAPLRETMTLFYINGYSHQQISAFLEVPVSTVKSRLHASRKKINERMVTMAKHTFDQNKPGKDLAGKVIQGVPRVGFFQGGQHCPESFTFSSCLAAVVRHLGEDYGLQEIQAHGQTWLLNKAYVHIMGMSGEAFRFFWKPGWHLDNSGLLDFNPESLRFIDQAFAGIGYQYQLLHKGDASVDKDCLRQAIVKHLTEYNRPVLGFGVVGPPECVIITGFDQSGDVLYGWSFFQDQPEHAVGVDFEPCGYFRKRKWYEDTHAVILIDDKADKPSAKDLTREALAWAVELIRKPTIQFNGIRPSGSAAFDAWSQALAQDKDFPEDDMETLRHNHLVHTSSVGMIAEGRWYGSHFLRQVTAKEPQLADALQPAIDCFEEEHQLMWQIWGLAGGPGFSDEQVLKLADPDIRQQIIPLIQQARELDLQASDAMEKARSSHL